MSKQKIIEYMVIRDEEISELIKRVRWRIDEGWQPLGGVAYNSKDYYMQAMVKYEHCEVEDE